MEATHAKFDTFWRRYKVIDVESEIPGERLLECVLDFKQKYLVDALKQYAVYYYQIYPPHSPNISRAC